MTSEPYASARARLLGRRQRQQPPRPARRGPAAGALAEPRLVHLPTHASWLNQIEIYFSIVQRKVLDPQRLPRPRRRRAAAAGLRARYEQTAAPFHWRFTRADLNALLRRQAEKDGLARAA